MGISMEIDNEEMRYKLTIGFILREYYTMFPEMQIMGNIKSKAIEKYRTDPYFHARVETVVCSVMSIVEEYFYPRDAQAGRPNGFK